MSNPKNEMSVSQAATYVNVVEETIRRWIRQGELPAELVKVKGLRKEYRIKKFDLGTVIGK